MSFRALRGVFPNKIVLLADNQHFAPQISGLATPLPEKVGNEDFLFFTPSPRDQHIVRYLSLPQIQQNFDFKLGA